MSLTFYDQLPPVRNGNALRLFSVRRDGAMTLSAAAVEKLRQEKGGLVTLASDADNTWYLVFGPLAGRRPFTWKRQGGGNGTKALQFFSQGRAAECFAAHQANGSIERLYFEVMSGHERRDGVDLYRLELRERQPTKRPVVPFSPPATPRPDEATMHRLSETVRVLAGLQLHKREKQELCRAYGLLNAHPEWVGTIAGGTKLLDKLRAEVG